MRTSGFQEQSEEPAIMFTQFTKLKILLVPVVEQFGKSMF